jgi:hypothetical protein
VKTEGGQVRVRSLVVFGLIVALALGALALTGCGGSGGDETAAKAAVVAGLAKIDTTIADLTQKGTSGSLTVADIKATRDSMKGELVTLFANAKKIKGADVSKAEAAWNDLDAAVTSLPDTATLMDAAGVLMTKVPALTSALADIQALVTPKS